MGQRTQVENNVRDLLGDNLETGNDIFSVDGNTEFILTEENAQTVNDVYRNDVLLDSGDWSYDSTTNSITITSTLNDGDTIRINYTFYSRYSTAEIRSYINSALIQISINNYKTFELVSDDFSPELEDNEVNLVSAITAIIMNPDNKSYRLPDITINVPSSSLPLNEMISKTIKIYKRNCHGIFSIS